MDSNLLIVLLTAGWGISILTFLFYLSGRKKRHQRTLEKHLMEHDQVFLSLQRSEERYNKLISHMNEGLIFTDNKDQICFINKCACNILKANKEKVLKRPISDFLLSKSDVNKLGLPYELKRHGCSHREEIQMVRQNGEMFWANLNISYLDSLHDNMPGAIIVMMDITEQKMTEDKLHNLTINLNQRVKQLDCLFEISDISNSPGITTDAILRKSIELIPLAMKNPANTWVEISLGDDKKFASKNIKDTIWTYASPIKGSRKKIGTLRVGYTDHASTASRDVFQVSEKVLIKNVAEKLAQIIELKEMKQSLNEGLAQLKQLQEITSIGNWEIDLIGKKVTYSDDFFEVMGIPVNERSTYNPEVFYQHLHPDDLLYMKKYVQKITDRVFGDLSYAFRYRTGSGRVRYIVGNGKPIFDTSNRPTRIAGTVQDITNQIKRFKELSGPGLNQ